MKQVGYPSYKTTKSPWLAFIPEHWEEKRLKDVATYNDESLDEKTDPDFEIEYVDISSVSLTHGIEKTELLAFEKAPSRARRKVRHGDVIVSTVRTYLKAIAPIKNPPLNMVVSTGFAVIRPRPSLDARFAGYMLQSNGFVGDVVANSVGVSYPAINASDLARLPFAEPPLPEQIRISDFLDHKTAQIDALIAKKQSLLNKLAEQRTALISQAVTKGLDPSVSMKDSGVDWLGEIPAHWSYKRLKFLVAVQGGGTPNTGKPEYWNGDIPWVSPKDMKYDFIDTTEDYLTQKGVEESATRLINSNAVLIVVRSGILRHTIPVARNTCVVSLNQDMKALTTNTELNPGYLHWFINGLQKGLLPLWSKPGCTVESIELNYLLNTHIPLPPHDEQQQIEDYVADIRDDFNNRMAKVEKVIQKLNEYRSALITNAVTGKIDVRGFCIPTSAEQKEVAHG
ncbi:restriction endonuclease subunit S [Salinivibrio sp. VYel8]|uniref:restriction endonuclease subunit S n=1 Tax=unclassified Salinivibrio TaxID=2636825 RepID=UPI00128E7D40|nr:MULTISPECIES: restriction endonuclease subunit S [unclassified Salinivibrio]MPY06094.1 restriction endonuclease subunit S [Salinivibrio sp. VYel8]MPY14179.1 restriction endonuclease subunit S [Salinivibrio sp. VGrn1]